MTGIRVTGIRKKSISCSGGETCTPPGQPAHCPKYACNSEPKHVVGWFRPAKIGLVSPKVSEKLMRCMSYRPETAVMLGALVVVSGCGGGTAAATPAVTPTPAPGLSAAAQPPAGQTPAPAVGGGGGRGGGGRGGRGGGRGSVIDTTLYV